MPAARLLRRLLVPALLTAVRAPGQQPAAPERVPLPAFETLEPAVAAQIRGLEADLTALLATSSAGSAALAEAYGELGQLFHAYEIWESASASYRNATRLAPRDYRWVHLLADVDMRRGDLEGARRHHEAALAARPGDLPSLVGLGDASLGLNRLDEAEKAFRQAIRLDARSAAAHAGLGRTALVRRDFATARDEFLSARTLAPDANRLHYELAMAYRGLGDRGETARHLAAAGTVGVRVADPLLERVSSLRQGEKVHLVRGRLAFVNGRLREAAEEFGAAVEAEPRSVTGLVGLGSALGMLGETDRALEALRRALALAPTSVPAHYNVGRLLEARGDTEAALEEFETVIRLAPQDEDALRARADLLSRIAAKKRPAGP